MINSRSPKLTGYDSDAVTLVDSEDESFSGSDTESGKRRRNYFQWACGAVVVSAIGLVGYSITQRAVADLGPWTAVETRDETGIQVSVNHNAVEADAQRARSVAATPMVQSSSDILRSRGSFEGDDANTAPASRFCNDSVPVIEHWGVRGPFQLDPYWDKKCHDPSTMPPLTWNWPGRNWCWVRTKTRSCYPHDGEKQVPNWYWAQHHVFEDGFAPNPDEELLEAYVNPELCDLPQLGLTWLDTPGDQRAAAIEWVRENIAIYVVNLPTSVERWQKMEARFHELGLQAHRIPGVDLRPPGALQRAQEEGVVPADYNYEEALHRAHKLFENSEEGGIWKLTDELGIGTVGCAAAHLRAQRLAHNLTVHAGKPMTLIMEDDIWLTDDFAPKLQYILNHEMPCGWDLYALTTRCGYGQCVGPHVSRVQPDGNEPEERCHNSGNYGMFAMLYKTESLPKINDMLKEVCFNDQKPACLPVDIAMASISDRIAYYAAPGSQQPGMAVEAGWGGSNRWNVNKQTMRGADAARMDHALHKKKGNK